MRNMSFALTTQQIKDRTKTVTRRLGWKNLKPGELIQAIEKGQGLKKGEHPVKLCVIKIKSVRSEPLQRMALERLYGTTETMLEGFGMMHGVAFVHMFCKHNKCLTSTIVQRIEFTYA